MWIGTSNMIRIKWALKVKHDKYDKKYDKYNKHHGRSHWRDGVSFCSYLTSLLFIFDVSFHIWRLFWPVRSWSLEGFLSFLAPSFLSAAAICSIRSNSPCCSVLQRVVACCSVLRCVVVCCSMLQCDLLWVVVWCSVLQCAAVCCNVW